LNEDKSARYHRLKRRTAIAGLAIQAAVLGLLLATGASAALRTWAMHLTGEGAASPATVAVYVAVVVVLQAAASVPLGFYDGYVLEHRYGLSCESVGAFARDGLKAGALNLALALAVGQILYAAMRAWPHWWWIAAAIAVAAFIALLAGLAPVLLLPLFYRFKPLDRSELRERLTTLSKRAGVRVLGVYEWGLGDKTRRANAALVGSGRTRRVLVSDTLLAEYSDDEIEVILAHELGHHAHRDMLTVLVLEALVIAGALGVAAAVQRTTGAAFGLIAPADVAGLPLLVLSGSAFVLVATPLVNWVSRHHERRADRFALDLTQRPAAFVSAMRRLGAQNLAETNPSTLSLWLFHSHPPVEQRIAAARAFQGD
jgi:STE24 endopeptidase